jgi:hypothetical protein
LLPKDALRAALADEVEEHGPEVALVFIAESFACGAEWLAWATARPYRRIRTPASESKCKRPSADSGEEMATSKPSKVIWLYIND